MSRFLLLGVTLLQCDASPTGTIVQLFQWRWTDVAMECCAYLGPNGFDAVQISPPMEQITASQWWASYQPVSYNIGNRLGDEAAFTAMVSKCRGCGVSIIADAVTNHMAAGSGTGSSGSSFGGRTFPGTYMARDFHHNDGDEANNCVISNYQDKWNVQHCDLVGLPDLDSGASWPQTRLGAYLGALAELGVAGFRIDAAKHQDAANLGAILTNNASARGKQVYQEVIGAPNEAVQPSEYTSNGLVTEFGFSYAISNAVRNGQLASLRTATDNLLPSASALAFIDNHDSQRSGAVLASSNPKALVSPHVHTIAFHSHRTSTTVLASSSPKALVPRSHHRTHVHTTHVHSPRSPFRLSGSSWHRLERDGAPLLSAHVQGGRALRHRQRLPSCLAVRTTTLTPIPHHDLPSPTAPCSPGRT
jgi:alpha-amylase